MNTALSIIDAITPNTDIDYRQEMNVIHEIVAECEKEIAFMHQVNPEDDLRAGSYRAARRAIQQR
ncbi:TPA: hypothetical protein JLG99_004515 [Escherichia coli]|nr:hypothetical protein [Escherichia coli]